MLEAVLAKMLVILTEIFPCGFPPLPAAAIFLPQNKAKMFASSSFLTHCFNFPNTPQHITYISEEVLLIL
jgi:hypothetical protein